MGAEDAIFRHGALAFRPIMMTTFAALLSAIRLHGGAGQAAEIPASRSDTRHRRRPAGYPRNSSLTRHRWSLRCTASAAAEPAKSFLAQPETAIAVTE